MIDLEPMLIGDSCSNEHLRDLDVFFYLHFKDIPITIYAFIFEIQ